MENINDADPLNEEHQKVICKFKDAELENFQVSINNIPAILKQHKSISQICITRQIRPPDFWHECFTDMYQFITDNPQRQFSIKYLRSPSRGARKGVVGNFCDFIKNRWLQQGYVINP